MGQNLSWEANQFEASQHIPHILWNQKVHYHIHKGPPTSPNWTSSIQSIHPHPTSWRSILILSSHLCLCLPSGLSLRFPHQNLEYASPLPYTCYIPHPSHFSQFYHPKNIGWAVQIIKFPPLPSHLAPLRPKYSPNTLFLHPLSLHSSLSVSDQIPHPYKTSAKIPMKQYIATKYALLCFLQLPQHTAIISLSNTNRFVSTPHSELSVKCKQNHKYQSILWKSNRFEYLLCGVSNKWLHISAFLIRLGQHHWVNIVTREEHTKHIESCTELRQVLQWDLVCYWNYCMYTLFLKS